MLAPFFSRLHDYYLSVAKVLRGEAEVASIFPNTSDIGITRETAYLKFLQQHVPKKCNVFLGGFLFGSEGEESSQLDVIVTTDTCPRYDFNSDVSGSKSFAPVEGTLAVVSVKSTLNRAAIDDSLKGMASVPPTLPLDNRVTFGLSIPHYDDWPFKVVYASDGVALETATKHVNEYYESHSEIPLNRRPDLIHVIGKYVLAKSRPGLSTMIDPVSRVAIPVPFGEYIASTAAPDVQGLIHVIEVIQRNALASGHIIYSYTDLSNRVSVP